MGQCPSLLLYREIPRSSLYSFGTKHILKLTSKIDEEALEFVEKITRKTRRLPLDVLTALLSRAQSRHDDAYPDTGESGETYDAELCSPETPVETC